MWHDASPVHQPYESHVIAAYSQYQINILIMRFSLHYLFLAGALVSSVGSASLTCAADAPIPAEIENEQIQGIKLGRPVGTKNSPLDLLKSIRTFFAISRTVSQCETPPRSLAMGSLPFRG